jgi:glycosyltransferase involved in cell wall biosynthesis
MKLLFDATVFEIPFSGIAKSTLYLYEACLKIDPSVNFIGFIRNKLSQQLPDNIIIEKLPSIFIKQLRYSSYTINKLLSKYDASVIHFPWNGTIPKETRGKKIITLHDVLPLEIPGYFQNDMKKKMFIKKKQNDLNIADIVFTDSEYSKQKIINNFSIRHEPIVLNYGPTIEDSLSDISIPLPDKPYFLYVGGFDKRKGIKSLLRSFLHFHKTKQCDCYLLIIGEQNYIDAETSAFLKEGIDNKIIKLTGYVTDEELACYYKNALALIYLSKYEGFGLPPLEAMYLGCPVITTKYSSIPEICGDTAHYVEPDDMDNVSSAMYKVFSDSKLREDMIMAGRKQASKFSWEKSAALFLDVIRT